MMETEKKMTPAPPDCKPHKKDCPDVTTKEGKEMKDAEYQLIREEVGQRESVSVKFVETALQTSDVLTKPVTRGIFERHSRRLLGEEWLFDGEADLATDLHADT